MFHLLKNLSDTYTWPVTVMTPGDGGKVIAIKFDARFNRLPVDRVREMTRSAEEMPEGEKPMTIPQAVAEALVEIQYKDDSGKVEIASAEDQARLLALVGADVAIWAAFRSSMSGEKAKN